MKVIHCHTVYFSNMSTIHKRSFSEKMMMEDDDEFNSDEEGDFVPLISSDSSSLEIKQKYLESNPSTKNKCMLVLAISIGCAGILFGYSIVRLGQTRMGDDTKPLSSAANSLDLPVPTCQQRFNKTYQDVFHQINSHQESLCSDHEIPRCDCQNPLAPMTRTTADEMINLQLNRHFAENLQVANRTLDHPYDVVFFGDSITRGWNPRVVSHGNSVKSSIDDAFSTHFTKESGGKVDGVALGVGGDRCPQLLYRLRNGELPDQLQSKVFWVLIGTNEMNDLCSVEAMVAGIIQIAQELVHRRPDSVIVLNSILPKGDPGSDIFTNGAGWPQLATVNHWLECYAAEQERVEFFNATDIFLQPNTTMTVAKYYRDYVHPSRLGYAQWAPVIVDKVLELIQTYQL